MKNISILLVFLVSFSFGQSMYKKVDDATNSGVTKGTALLDEERPAGLIIKHVKDNIDFNGNGKVLDKDGNVKLIRLNVKFDFDKYDIKDKYQREIDEAAKFLQNHKTLNTTIEGHTDSKGTREYNYILSKLRAKRVASVLVAKGIDVNRIVIKGFGEIAPIADNKTEYGRSQNRRVDISFNK
jgi:OOP family OmpA-OmpF porin